MITGIKERGWAIKIEIQEEDLVKELDRYVKELDKMISSDVNKVASKLVRRETRKVNKTKNIGRKNPSKLKAGRRNTFVGGNLGIAGALKRHIIPDLIKHKETIDRVAKDIKFDGRGIYRKLFQSEVGKIQKNVETRLSIAFPKNPGRIGNAVSDTRFSGIKFERNTSRFFGGIGNISVLDEWTSIYVDKDGAIYEPPQDYGNIHAFWRFWEFTGVGAQKVFKSPSSFWYVLKKGWLRRGELAPRPFLLKQNGDLYDEDKVIVRGIGKVFLNEIIDQTNKTGAKINPLTSKFFGK